MYIRKYTRPHRHHIPVLMMTSHIVTVPTMSLKWLNRIPPFSGTVANRFISAAAGANSNICGDNGCRSAMDIITSQKYFHMHGSISSLLQRCRLIP